MSAYKYCENCGKGVPREHIDEQHCIYCRSTNLFVDWDEWGQYKGRDFTPVDDEPNDNNERDDDYEA